MPGLREYSTTLKKAPSRPPRPRRYLPRAVQCSAVQGRAAQPGRPVPAPRATPGTRCSSAPAPSRQALVPAQSPAPTGRLALLLAATGGVICIAAPRPGRRGGWRGCTPCTLPPSLPPLSRRVALRSRHFLPGRGGGKSAPCVLGSVSATWLPRFFAAVPMDAPALSCPAWLPGDEGTVWGCSEARGGQGAKPEGEYKRRGQGPATALSGAGAHPVPSSPPVVLVPGPVQRPQLFDAATSVQSCWLQTCVHEIGR